MDNDRDHKAPAVEVECPQKASFEERLVDGKWVTVSAHESEFIDGQWVVTKAWSLEKDGPYEQLHQKGPSTETVD